MAPNANPYRTLGLSRGATLPEVKRAYRQLAKSHHPDAAGEAALPRFLAIQAAYDQIIHGLARGGPATSGAPRRPWEADPVRADATRRAYGRRGRSSGGSARARPSGQTGSPGGAGAAGESPGASAAGGTGPGRGAAGEGAGKGRGGRAPKATLGSTSYDGAEAEPFEPDWGGASWYGTTSGTYWTLNPKEYADPRKHGPEYQARARRAAEAERRAMGGAAAEAEDPSPRDPDPEGAQAAADDHDAPAPDRPSGATSDPAPEPPPGPPPTHTTSSWWAATAASPASPVDPGTHAAGGPSPGHAAPPTPAESDLGPMAPGATPSGADTRPGGLRLRVGRLFRGQRGPVS